MHRRDSGRPLRETMRAAGLSGPQLAEMTKAIDPTGMGVSPAYIGFLTGEPGKSSTRESCGATKAGLIAQALGRDIQELFTDALPPSSTSTATTTTAESSNAMATTQSPATVLPESLITQEQLEDWLHVSEWWVNQMLRQGLPMEPIPGTGRKPLRRFKPSAVQAFLDEFNAVQSA